MGFSYTDPSDSTKDHIRLLIGDTVEKDELLNDEEIEFFITQEASVYLAASSAAEAVAAKIAREVSNSLEQSSIQLSDQFKHYKELARQLRIDAQRKGDKTIPATSGVTSTGETRDPLFTLGMHDYQGEQGASLTSPSA